MLQPSSLFSHFRTMSFGLTLMILFVGNLSFAAASSRPSYLNLLKHEASHEQWETYLREIDRTGPTTQDFMWFVEQMRVMSADVQTIDPVIFYLQTTRERMPSEFRWVLAAAEILRDKMQSETIPDAFAALRNTAIIQQFSISSGDRMSLNLKYSIASEAHRKSENRDARFQSLHDLLFFFGNLHRAPEFEPELFRHPVLERVRIDWISHLAVIAKEIHGQEILHAILNLSNPKIREFTNVQDKQHFLNRMINLVSEYGFRYGDVGLNSYGQASFALTDKNRVVFEGLRKLVRTWLLEDLVFASMNYDTYLRRGFITMDDFLTIPMNDLKKAQVEQILLKEVNKVEFAPYSLNALLWLKNYGDDGSAVSRIATERLVKILFEAELGVSNSVRFSQGLLLSQHVYPADYLRYIDAFYQVAIPPIKIDAGSLERIKTFRHLKFNFLQREEWLQLEARRLRFIQKHSTPANFVSYIRKIFVEGGLDYELADRIFVAYTFRQIGDPLVAQQMADELKAKSLSRFYLNKKSAVRAAWNKEEGKLVHLVFAMAPRDAQLNEYLVDLYVNHATDAAVSGQNALRMLEVIGTKDLSVRDEIFRSLQFSGAGDSAGTFRALLRLFPEHGYKMAEILFAHSGEREKKFAPMLKELVSQAVVNPEILRSIQMGIRENRNSPAANYRGYQGLRLDEWLERQVAHTLKIKEVKSCEVFWRNYEN